MKKLLVLCIMALFIMAPISIGAMDVTLQWDANTEPDLAGYRVHYGATSGVYDNPNSPKDVPLAMDENPDPDLVEYTVFDVPTGVETFFVVTAYDDETPSLESGYSNEVHTSAEDCISPEPPGGCKVFRKLCQ